MQGRGAEEKDMEEEEEEEEEKEEDMEEREELSAGAMACRRGGRLQHQYRGCPSARSPTPALTHQCQAVFPKEKCWHALINLYTYSIQCSVSLVVKIP